MTPTSFDVKICQDEIATCRWATIDELKRPNQIGPLTRRVLDLVSYGLQHGFDEVTLRSEECNSIYKNAPSMTLFCRNVKTEENLLVEHK